MRRVARWVACAALLLPGRALGQSQARVRVEENLRREPNGQVLARMSPGASVSVVGRRDRWVQVDVDGWVWARSLQKADREGFDLVVSAPEGENLRDAPSGTVEGRLSRGMLLGEVERRPGWIHVRRRAWIWSPSLLDVEPAAGSAPASSAPSAEAPVDAAPHGVIRAGASGAPILSAPGGDTVGVARGGAELEVVARQGRWARVRVEGWTWLPLADSAGAAQAETPDDRALTPAKLKADPAAYAGRMVTWQLQFISMEKAEKVRTDFFEGEPFLLARYGGVDGPFVYVAVPPDRVQALRGLVPLERITVSGRIRTGASSLTGTPIIDLVSLDRSRDSR